MKRLFPVVVVVGLLGLAAPVALGGEHAGDRPWFDMANCEFCVHLTKDSMLLPNLVWEHHNIEAGLMSVTVVKPGYKKSLDKAMAAMHAVGDEMMKGKQVNMCGYCSNYGVLTEAGVKLETVEGAWGNVMLLTSDKPEVVAMIQEHGQRTRDEHAKMKMAAKEKP